MNPVVVDIYQGNAVSPAQFKAMHQFGIRGVIHKASEGGNFPDSKYRERRQQILDEGMMLGAYHFLNSSPVKTQADFFLSRALPTGWDGKTLLACDHEDNRYGIASVDQLHEFLELVFKATGQRPVLYSGNTIKTQLGNRIDPYLAQHRNWVPMYSDHLVLQASWTKFFLWQYTGDGLGPLQPHDIPGLHNDDLNVYGGTDLAADWVHSDHAANTQPTAVPVVPIVPPTPPAVAKPAPGPTEPGAMQKFWDWFKTH